MRTTWASAAGQHAERAAGVTAGATAALLALAAGFYVARGPSWLHLDPAALGLPHLVALVVGTLCLLLVLRNPEAGLLLLVGVLYTNLSEVAVRNYRVPSLLQLLAAAVAASFAIRQLSSRGPAGARPVFDPLLVPLVAYCAVVLASSLVAEDAALADERLSAHLKGVLVFLLVINLTTSREALRRVVWVLVLSGALLGAITLCQALTGSYGHEFFGFGRVKMAQIVGGVREARLAGPLSDPNFYAQILVPLVPLALYRLWDEPAAHLKLLAALGLAAVTGALVFTYSRGGALAAGLALALAAVDKKIRLRQVLPCAALIALLLLWAPAEFGGRLETLGRLLPEEDEEALTVSAESSIEQRKLLMRTAWEMFDAHPVLGVGAGNYSEHFDEYAAHVGSATSSYENFGDRRYPHNLFLEVAAETGVLGLLTFAATVGGALLVALAAARRFRRAGDARAGGLAASIALALVAYMASSLFLHGHYVQYLWLLVALAAAAGRVARAEPEGTRATSPPA